METHTTTRRMRLSPALTAAGAPLPLALGPPAAGTGHGAHVGRAGGGCSGSGTALRTHSSREPGVSPDQADYIPTAAFLAPRTGRARRGAGHFFGFGLGFGGGLTGSEGRGPSGRSTAPPMAWSLLEPPIERAACVRTRRTAALRRVAEEPLLLHAPVLLVLVVGPAARPHAPRAGARAVGRRGGPDGGQPLRGGVRRQGALVGGGGVLCRGGGWGGSGWGRSGGGG